LKALGNSFSSKSSILNGKVGLFYLIILGITPFVLLLIPFLWKESEDLSLSKKINHEKFADFFTSILTLYGTIGAIYLASKQNKIAENNNEAVIKPDLIPEKSSFKMEDFPKRAEASLEKLSPWVIPKPILENSNVGLKVKNMGVGMARKISIEWKFDKAEVDKKIQGVYLPQNGSLITIPEAIGSSETKFLPLPNSYLSCCGPRLNKEHSPLSNIPFFPKEIEKDIPNEFVEAMKKYQPDLKPALSLILSYEDIQGRECTKEYDVALSGYVSELSLDFSLKKSTY